MLLISYYYKEILARLYDKKIVFSSCHTETEVQVVVFCKVLTITFIPIWASHKCIDIVCQNCKDNIDCYEYEDQNLTDFCGMLQKSAKIKWCYFLGTVFIAICVVWVFFDIFAYLD